MQSKETIGIALAVAPGLPAELHQQLLFVDRLGIVGLDKVTDDLDSLERTWPHEPSHILRLRDAGVAFPVADSLSVELLSDPIAGPALQRASAATIVTKELMNTYSGHIPEESVPAFFENMSRIDEHVEISRSYVARAFAVSVQRKLGLDAISLLPLAEERLHGDLPRDEVIRIIISEFPVPSPHVPPLEIVRFRNDPDNRDRLLALRHWANKVARGATTAFELRDELASTLSSYRIALRQLGRRYSVGTFQLVVTGIPEVTAQIAAGNFAKAAGTLFSITNAHARLLEEERELPGRELSYIVAAHRAFADRRRRGA